ncbi:hypothetical protein [Pseudomonas sp. TH31]|uniref:hypothetical protein n=1 Tax=Pseudomonas sp. TH31 TaxID=2796396 RepID=UPI001911F328|nr:hypothetical protein [Pseudomonas sp. TH31]MBK5415736.1 hypothetical protein [Pseudomonas sp. TH31]
MAKVCNAIINPLDTLSHASKTAKKAQLNIEKIVVKLTTLKDVVVKENRAASRMKETQLKGMLSDASNLNAKIDKCNTAIDKKITAKQGYQASQTRGPSQREQQRGMENNNRAMDQRALDVKNGDYY